MNAYHVIPVVKVWHVDYDWTAIFVLAVAGLSSLMATMGIVELLRLLLEQRKVEVGRKTLSQNETK